MSAVGPLSRTLPASAGRMRCGVALDLYQLKARNCGLSTWARGGSSWTATKEGQWRAQVFNGFSELSTITHIFRNCMASQWLTISQVGHDHRKCIHDETRSFPDLTVNICAPSLHSFRLQIRILITKYPHQLTSILLSNPTSFSWYPLSRILSLGWSQ